MHIKKIGKDATLGKILKKRGAGAVLDKYGVPCMSCPMAAVEIEKLEIGEVCKIYGLNLAEILKELNQLEQ